MYSLQSTDVVHSIKDLQYRYDVSTHSIIWCTNRAEKYVVRDLENTKIRLGQQNDALRRMLEIISRQQGSETNTPTLC